MTDEGKLHPDTKGRNYSEFPGEKPMRQCFVNTEDGYKDKKAYRYIYVSTVQISKKHRRKRQAERNQELREEKKQAPSLRVVGRAQFSRSEKCQNPQARKQATEPG
jgi:hypothetical protein